MRPVCLRKIANKILAPLSGNLTKSLVATPITKQVFDVVAKDLTKSLVATPITEQETKRKKQTLLDMVRSMMSLTTLPLSFWGYALEIGAYIVAPLLGPT